MATKLEVTERREGIDEYDTLIVEVTDTGTIVRDIATVHATEYADKLSAVDELLEALEEAERQLSQEWKIETSNWSIQHRDLYSRPDLCCFLDKYGIPVYPLAVAITKARAAISKAHGEQS